MLHRIRFLFFYILGYTEVSVNGQTDIMTMVPNKPDFVCPKPSGVFKKDCSSFYMCFRNNFEVYKCIEGMLFNEEKGACDSPENVPHCRTMDIMTTVPAKPDFICPKPSGVFKKDCTSFYMCFGNNFEVFICTEGMLFNEQKGSCDSAENVPNCSTEETTRATNIWTTVQLNNDLHTQKQVQTSNPKEKYKTPDNWPTNGAGTKLGTWMVSKLPENQQKSTESVNNVKITSPKATEISPRSLGKMITVDPDYVCPKPMGLFRNPVDCNSFYNCWEGRVHLQYCDEGLVFNELNKWCDYPETVPGCSAKILKKETKQPYDLTTVPSEFTEAEKETTKHPEVTMPENTRSSSSIAVGLSKISIVPGTTIGNAVTAKDYEGTTDPNFKCPEPRGQFRNAKECNSFYVCWDGKFTIVLCPDGLVFDDAQKLCDSPENVPVCGKVLKEGTEQSNDLTSKPSDFTVAEKEATKHPEVTMRENTRSSSSIAVSKISIVPRTTIGNSMTSKDYEGTTDPNFKCPEPRGQFRNAKECNSFYVCWDGKFNIVLCPDGLVFDDAQKLCDFPENVPGCGKERGLTPTADTHFICPQPMGQFKNSADCSSFYICWNGKFTQMLCQEGLVFNEVQKACDYPENVPGCNRGTTKQKGDDSHSTVQSLTSRLIEESKTKTEIPTSLKTILYKSTKAQKSSKYPESSTEEAAKAITDPNYKCEQPFGQFRNPQDCSSFYVCWEHKFHIVLCPEGLVFNKDVAACDDPENFPDCKEKIYQPTKAELPNAATTRIELLNAATTPNGLPKVATTRIDLQKTSYPSMQVSSKIPDKLVTLDPNYKCPQSLGLFRNPKDCGSFYNCWDYRPQLQLCGQNLVFNEAQSVCDYPHNVPGCNGDVIKYTTKEPVQHTNSPTIEEIRQTNAATEQVKETNAATTIQEQSVTKDSQQTLAAITKDLEQTGAATTMKALLSTSTEKDQLVTLDPNYKCPQPMGLFRNPKDCGSFYNCWEGRTQLQLCGQKLVFNEAIGRCDYPANVPDCNGGAIKYTTEYEQQTKLPTIEESQQTHAVTQHKEKTNAATEHTDKAITATAKQEQPTQDAVTKDFQLNTVATTMKELDITSTGKDKLTTMDPNYKCPKPFGLFKNPKDCGSYYNCWEERAQLQHCGQQLVFNEVISKCDYPQNVPGCDGDTIKYTTKEPAQQTNIPTREEIEKTNAATDQAKNTNAATTKQNQPTKTTNINLTQQPIVVTTMKELLITSTGKDKLATLDPNYKCPKPFGLFKNPKDCDSYYNCWEERAQLQHCGQQLAFNEVISKCDYPQNVPGCDGGTIKFTTKEPTQQTNIPTREEIEETHAATDQAKNTNAATTKQIQPSKTTNINHTQQPIVVTTMKELLITSTGKGQLATLDPNYKCPKPFGLFKNPKDCGSYYNCWEERAQLQHCGQQLVFNEVISKCDYPQNVPGCDAVIWNSSKFPNFNPVEEGHCPPGYIFNQDFQKCYKKVSQSLTWWKAEQFCHNESLFYKNNLLNDGHLLSFQHKTELNFLINSFKDDITTYWTSGNDYMDRKLWRWGFNLLATPFSYQSIIDPTEAPTCIYLDPTMLIWNAADCLTDRHYFICEIKMK